MPDMEWEFEPYYRLAEAVIKDCFFKYTPEANRSVIEFAERRPNRLLEAYADAAQIDQERLRSALKRNAEEKLHER